MAQSRAQPADDEGRRPSSPRTQMPEINNKPSKQIITLRLSRSRGLPAATSWRPIFTSKGTYVAHLVCSTHHPE
jgi:hypothetical protein